MPNGVSCAFFATKNFQIAKEENNIFRAGIAGAQTVRTADCATKIAPMIDNSSTVSKALGKGANYARKILYPLIIGSGIYKTVKSDDKVKTGISQVGAIGTMYGFEKVAETILNKTPIKNLKFNNKFLKPVPYVLKGLAYASASIMGYNTGNKLASKAVDKARESRNIFNDIETI